MTTSTRSLSTIAADIQRNWSTVSPYAAPYLRAMKTLRTIDDTYYSDDARSVVLYFLSNAAGWRGAEARRIKTELKAMLAN